MSLETPVADGTKIAGVKNAAGEEVQSSRLVMGTAGDVIVSSSDPLPVAIVSGGGGGAGGASETTLAALSNKLPASLGAKAASGSLSIVPATGVDFYPATQPVSGTVGINGTVPVSGTFWQATQPVSGNVSVSGTVAVSGPLTDTQLRATSVPISATSLPLPAGAATESKLEAARVILAAVQAATENMQPSRNHFAIAPHDTNAITPLPRAVRVNAGGTVTYRTVDSTADVTITVADKELILGRIQYIRATGTAATGFVGQA